MSNHPLPSEDTVRDIVRRVLHRTLGHRASTPTGHHKHAKRKLVDHATINALEPGSVLEVAPNSLITPLARDAAQERNITLQQALPSGEAHIHAPAAAETTGNSGRNVALGADHGGYHLKESLVTYLQSEGYAVIDCGTDSIDSVDYPDYAYAVAQHVSSGHAWRGIIIDGAGVGSCMAANKVPGVRAAMCYDQATAVNSREHNNANILTLGAGLIGKNLAKQIARTWLTTPFGGGRHARRVDKIMDIEHRFSR